VRFPTNLSLNDSIVIRNNSNDLSMASDEKKPLKYHSDASILKTEYEQLLDQNKFVKIDNSNAVLKIDVLVQRIHDLNNKKNEFKAEMLSTR
jgi:hypothetical protein